MIIRGIIIVLIDLLNLFNKTKILLGLKKLNIRTFILFLRNFE